MLVASPGRVSPSIVNTGFSGDQDFQTETKIEINLNNAQTRGRNKLTSLEATLV